MLSHTGSPGPVKRVGHFTTGKLFTCLLVLHEEECCHAVTLQREVSGVRFWPVFWRDQGSVVGGPCRCEELFWEARWGGEGPVPVGKALLSLSLSCLYYKFISQLHQEVTVSNGIIVLIVWWYSGSGYPMHQWDVRENNMGRSSRREDNWSWSSSNRNFTENGPTGR